MRMSEYYSDYSEIRRRRDRYWIAAGLVGFVTALGLVCWLAVILAGA